MTDVVYLVGNGQRDWLRYSLRSLANLPHERVWMVGAVPQWVTGVETLEVPQQRSQGENTTENLRQACQHEGITDKFLLFNDDFYVTEPVDEMPQLHRGPVDEVMHHTPMGQYRRGGEATAKLIRELGLPEPVLSYEMHAPLWVRKADMLRALPLGMHIYPRRLHKRSLYGNLVQLGGEQTADPKIHDTKSPLPPGPCASTSSKAFLAGVAGRQLRAMFPEPCLYERE